MRDAAGNLLAPCTVQQPGVRAQRQPPVPARWAAPRLVPPAPPANTGAARLAAPRAVKHLAAPTGPQAAPSAARPARSRRARGNGDTAPARTRLGRVVKRTLQRSPSLPARNRARHQ